MKMEGAVIRRPETDWSVEEFELDGLRACEVLVRYTASGCATATTTSGPVTRPGGCPRPVVTRAPASSRSGSGGHRVVVAFLPNCGRCRWCASGRTNR